jgi:hypothetical protein
VRAVAWCSALILVVIVAWLLVPRLRPGSAVPAPAVGQGIVPNTGPDHSRHRIALATSTASSPAGTDSAPSTGQQDFSWVDLLASEQFKHWQSFGLKGFRLKPGRMQLFGPEVGTAPAGLIGYPDEGGFRSFEIELEFTLKGTIDLPFPALRGLDDGGEHWTLSTSGEGALAEGRTYILQAQVTGGSLSGELVPDGVSLPSLKCPSYKSRDGAIGIQIRPGTEMEISRFLVRRLRDA